MIRYLIAQGDRIEHPCWFASAWSPAEGARVRLRGARQRRTITTTCAAAASGSSVGTAEGQPIRDAAIPPLPLGEHWLVSSGPRCRRAFAGAAPGAASIAHSRHLRLSGHLPLLLGRTVALARCLPACFARAPARAPAGLSSACRLQHFCLGDVTAGHVLRRPAWLPGMQHLA